MRIEKKNIRQGFGIFQLIFFCLIMLNSILFIHSHRLDDGRIVIHAHPFFPQEDGTPLPHQHNAGELIILSQSFQPNIVISEISLFDFSAPTLELKYSKAIVDIHFIHKTILYCSRRGPPTVSFLT